MCIQIVFRHKTVDEMKTFGALRCDYIEFQSSDHWRKYQIWSHGCKPRCNRNKSRLYSSFFSSEFENISIHIWWCYTSCDLTTCEEVFQLDCLLKSDRVRVHRLITSFKTTIAAVCFKKPSNKKKADYRLTNQSSLNVHWSYNSLHTNRKI